MPANLLPAFVDLTPYLDRPIVEALRGETVIEFPTLYVWTVKPPEGSAVVEEKVEVAVPIGRKGGGMREEVAVEEAGEGEGEGEDEDGVLEKDKLEEEEEVQEEEEEAQEEGKAEVEKEEEIEDQILVDIEETEVIVDLKKVIDALNNDLGSIVGKGEKEDEEKDVTDMIEEKE